MHKFAVPILFALAANCAFANAKGDQILHQIDALKFPTIDESKRSNQAYVKSFMPKMLEYERKRGDLILRLYRADPDNSRMANLMQSRWLRFGSPAGQQYRKAVDADIDRILSDGPPEAIKENGEYSKVMVDGWYLGDAKATVAEANAFIDKHPNSDLSPDLLFSLSTVMKGDDRAEVLRELVSKYPDFRLTALAKGALAQMDMIGKPISLKFSDATSGNPVDLSAMKGKVVLIDFWATWCPPCVAEMPHLKEIYDQYHSKGLEILGVSLDNSEAQGGLTSLKAFVAKHEIPWPMYYQGNGGDSKFSSSWGIVGIPTVFLVDKNGLIQGIADPNSSGFITRLEKYLNE